MGEGISYLFFSEVVPKISLLSQFDCTEWTKWLIWVWFWSLRPLSPPTTSGSVVSFLNKLSNHLFVTFISVWHSCPNIGITHHSITLKSFYKRRHCYCRRQQGHQNSRWIFCINGCISLCCCTRRNCHLAAMEFDLWYPLSLLLCWSSPFCENLFFTPCLFIH